MKYFISNTGDGCWYYRCYLPMLYNGFSGDREGFGQNPDREKDATMSINSDIVIFHRPDTFERLEAMLALKKLGKKIVFDNDDTFKDVGTLKDCSELEKRNRILDTFIREADLVTTTTEFLAEEYRKLNKNVVVLKNCINPSDFKPKIDCGESKKVRIGIFGSATLNGDSEPILPLLEELGDRDDVQLVMFGLAKTKDKKIKELYNEDIRFWKNIKTEWHPLVPMKDYFKTLAELKLDIVLIPRKDNYFNRCKSNLKFLEASMLEIPVIAQGFEDGLSPYEKDKDFCFIAYNDEDWGKYAEKLINNRKLRVNIGERAKEYVLENYNIKTNYKSWAEAYKKII